MSKLTGRAGECLYLFFSPLFHLLDSLLENLLDSITLHQQPFGRLLLRALDRNDTFCAKKAHTYL